MRRRAAVFERTYRYFILTVLFSALVFVPYLWVQFVGVAAASISFGFATVSFAEYHTDKRIARYKEEREQELYEAHYEDNLRLEEIKALGFYTSEINKMTKEKISLASFMSADLFAHWHRAQSINYYFSEGEARWVIFNEAEEKYGYIRLPSQQKHSSNSRAQNVIKTVTHELEKRGCAQREGNKPNGRAYLTVSQEDAMDALYPGNGENDGSI